MTMMTRKEALASIKVRRRTIGGHDYTTYDVYLGMDVLNKKPIRLYANSKNEMERKIGEYFDRQETLGSFATALTAYQVVDAQEALRRLAAAHLDMTLTDCVKAHLERIGSMASNPKSIGDAYDEFLTSKAEGADKDKTISTTGKWVEKAGRDRLVGSVTTNEIESYLKTNYDSMAVVTYNSHFSYLFTFLNWCAHAKRKYIPANPMAALDKKVVAWKEPEYLSVDDTRKLFAALEAEKDTYPELLAHAVTNMFTGTRREEIIRMGELNDAARINIEDETIRIAKGKGYTRGRAPRTAHIEPNALAWMKSFPYLEALKKVNDGTTSRLKHFAERHGIALFRNCGRHTFITMHVAAYGDPQKTQAMVGTSSKMRAEHYDGLASKKEGLAYFAIYPKISDGDRSQPEDPVA